MADGDLGVFMVPAKILMEPISSHMGTTNKPSCLAIDLTLEDVFAFGIQKRFLGPYHDPRISGNTTQSDIYSIPTKEQTPFHWASGSQALYVWI